MKYTPYPYQAFAEKFVLEHKAAGLFLDMGLGKTAITLSACEKLLRDYFETSKVLVIAPLLPARETWPDELAKWDQLEGLTYSLIIGTAQERIDALHTDADFYIVNRENVVWLVDYYKKKWPFDMVVIDELSSFKSSKAQRFRALRKVRKYIDRIVGLTGTPAPNGLLDLWSQVYLLDEGARLGRTLSAYRDTYFMPGRRGPNGIVYDWNLKDGAREAIFAKLSDLCISMETTGLPERLTIPHEVKLSEKAAAMYQQLERTMLLPFADGDVDTATAAILTNKLLQLAGGAVYDENGKAQIVHDQKLEVLDQLITERAKQHKETEVIFYDVSGLREAQKQLNAIVADNQIALTAPAHLYALVGESNVKAEFTNNSKGDTYKIEIRRNKDNTLIADAFELAARKSISTLTLLEIPEFGNVDCTVTITAFRDGKQIGSMRTELALHTAYLWPKEVQ